METKDASQFSIAFSPLIVSYTVEILPFALRAKGFTVFNFAISLSLIFNQYVNPVALDAIAWKYYVRLFLRYIAFLASRLCVDRILLLAGLRARIPVLLHRRNQEQVARGNRGAL